MASQEVDPLTDLFVGRAARNAPAEQVADPDDEQPSVPAVLESWRDQPDGEPARQPWRPRTDSAARWCLRVAAEAQGRIDEAARWAEDERGRIDRWLADVTHGDRQAVARFTGLAEAYVAARRADDPAFRTLKAPHGQVTTRKAAARFEIVDLDGFLDWVRERAGVTADGWLELARWVKVSVRTDDPELASDGSLAGDAVRSVVTGELVPGLAVGYSGRAVVPPAGDPFTVSHALAQAPPPPARTGDVLGAVAR